MSQRRPLLTEEDIVNRSTPVRLLATIFWLTLAAGMALIIAYLAFEALLNGLVNKGKH